MLSFLAKLHTYIGCRKKQQQIPWHPEAPAGLISRHIDYYLLTKSVIMSTSIAKHAFDHWTAS